MHKINKKGQSTVEYVLLVAAVIAVMIAFTTNNDSGIRGELNSTLVSATGQISNLAERISGSEGTYNGSSPVSGYAPVDPTKAE